jgi:hypothetical protein
MNTKQRNLTAETSKDNKFRPQTTNTRVVSFRSFAPLVLGGNYLLNKKINGGVQ